MSDERGIPAKDEFADRAVPMSARLPWWKPSLIWLGFSTQFISFYVGGQIFFVVGMPGAVIGIMLGCVFLVIESGLLAWASAKWGYSFPMMARATWGSQGFLIPTLLLATLVTGWFAYQALATGDIWFHVWNTPAGLMSAIFAILFAITAFRYRFMVYARYAAVPALLILIGYIFVYQIIPNWDMAWGRTVEAPDFSFAVATGISFFVISSIMTGDVVRFCKKPLDSVWVTIVAFIVGNGIALSIGAIATAANPEAGAWFGLVAVQLGIPVVLLATLVNWASGDACLYNAVMGYTNIHKKMKWSWAIIICGGIGTIFAGTAWLLTVVPFMLTIGTLVPPVAGVLIADYYWVRKDVGQYKYERKGLASKWNILALIAIVVGILLAWLSMTVVPGLPNQITGIVSAFLFYGILARAFGRQWGLLPKEGEVS